MLDNSEVLERLTVHRDELQARRLIYYSFQKSLCHASWCFDTKHVGASCIDQYEKHSIVMDKTPVSVETREEIEWSDFLHSCQEEFRALLERYECEERLILQRGFDRFLGAKLHDPVYSCDLDIVVSESVQRGVVEHSYFDMLLEACWTQEIIARRDLELYVECAQRETIRSSELSHWICHRHQYLKRRLIEQDYERCMDRFHSQNNFILQQQDAREQFNLIQKEQHERGLVEREQRLGFGFVLDQYACDHGNVYYHQLKFEMRHRLVNLSQSTVGVDETVARSLILLHEKTSFDNLSAREVKAFLLARHNVLSRERELHVKRGELYA